MAEEKKKKYSTNEMEAYLGIAYMPKSLPYHTFEVCVQDAHIAEQVFAKQGIFIHEQKLVDTGDHWEFVFVVRCDDEEWDEVLEKMYQRMDEEERGVSDAGKHCYA